MSEKISPVPPVSPRRVRLVKSKAPKDFMVWRWLAAAPALLALASSVVMAVIMATRSPGDILPWYKQQADQALADHDYPLASVCYQRLAADEPGDAANDFGLALSLNGAGRQREATELLLRLTPPDGPGYPPARLLLAQELLASPSKTSAVMDRGEQNLLQVVEAEPLNENAHALLATLYASQEKWALCKYHLARSGALRDKLQGRLFPAGVPATTRP